jgi:hypothetical protein
MAKRMFSTGMGSISSSSLAAELLLLLLLLQAPPLPLLLLPPARAEGAAAADKMEAGPGLDNEISKCAAPTGSNVAI